MINKGETKNISFTISVEDLKFYNSNLDFVAEPGEFKVAIGTNSDVALKNCDCVYKLLNSLNFYLPN